jgi:hypothetical protein
LKNAVFWDVTLCGYWKNGHFEGTSLLTRATQLHMAEDSILQSPPWKPQILHGKYLYITAVMPTSKQIEVYNKQINPFKVLYYPEEWCLLGCYAVWLL